MKRVRYRLEHYLLLAVHALCRILPWQIASKIFGSLAAMIGSRMAMNRKAVRHIKAALHVDDKEAQAIAKDHWRNLGCVMAEFPNLDYIAKNNVRIQGIEYLKALRDDGKAGILFGAHLGNWEVVPHALIHYIDLAAHPVYRAPNNPYVDARLHKYRSINGRLTPYPKSRKGMMGMVKALKNGEHLGLLIDQKYNEGISVPFFGMQARTGTAFIELAHKYQCPIVPLRCIREKNGFCIDVAPPLSILNRDVEDILAEVHALLEGWIKEHPEQWLWVHRRWRPEDLRVES
jgi:KDO2-lipid IV(A) lauroyltransferase